MSRMCVLEGVWGDFTERSRSNFSERVCFFSNPAGSLTCDSKLFVFLVVPGLITPLTVTSGHSLNSYERLEFQYVPSLITTHGELGLNSAVLQIINTALPKYKYHHFVRFRNSVHLDLFPLGVLITTVSVPSVSICRCCV